MKKYEWFMGIDVSKEKLDVALWQGREVHTQAQIVNTPKAIAVWVNGQVKAHGVDMDSCLICMEHTGMYSYPLMQVAGIKQWNLCVESALQIKQSMGMQRGKNDQIDAMRIAQYAYKNADDVRLWQPERAVVSKLKSLTRLRTKLVKYHKALASTLQETKAFKDASQWKDDQKICTPIIHLVRKQIKEVDSRIQETIESDDQLKVMNELITSIPAVGAVTAAAVIVYTNEFKNFHDPRQFACYAGVVPYEHSSGSSVRGKARVSHQANHTLKHLLQMVAIVAIQHNPEMIEYYTRKQQEGKNNMAILNAIRNKMIHRIFACIRDNRPYQKYPPKNLVQS